jgi:hypothetical protein
MEEGVMSIPLGPRVEIRPRNSEELSEAKLSEGLPKGRLIVHGRIFVVSRIRARADSSGDWKEAAMDDLGDFYQARAADLCQKIFQQQIMSLMEISSESKTINIVFTCPKPLIGGFRDSLHSVPVIGRFIGKYQELPSPKIQFIETFTKDSDRGSVIDFDPENFSANTIEKLEKLLEKNKDFLMIPHYCNNKKDPPTTSLTNEALTNEALTQGLQACIRDAGSTDNKCLALSMAKNEIENSGDIEKIVEKYQLPGDLVEQLQNKEKNKQIKLLAKALIEKASDNIVNNDKFLMDIDETGRYLTSTEPSFACLASALIDANIGTNVDRHQEDLAQSLQENNAVKMTTRQKLIKKYTSIIKAKGEMLDLPFIVALNPPFIVIKKNDRGFFEIITSNNKVTLDSDPCEINSLYYNGINHYQSIILGSNGEGLIRQLLFIENKKRIQYFKEMESVKNLAGCKEAIQHLIEFNPEYKETIIEKIASQGKDVKELLNSLNNFLFAKKAAQLFFEL